jgi:aminoglycoside phosphotransferase (APT) family kinase protein
MMARKMHDDQIDSNAALVHSLLSVQFPRWANLSIEAVRSTGTDNALYRLGNEMVVRMPLRPSATHSIDKEHRWLPLMAQQLPVQIPVPIARGEPTGEFPWPWSVVSWIDGTDATAATKFHHRTPIDIAHVVAALHSIDPTGGPEPDPEFGRGVPLANRDRLTRWAIDELGTMIDYEAAITLWECAVEVPEWDRPAVWVHGDIASGNILVRDGRVVAVIDWGCLGVGDPACDLIIAWEMFDPIARHLFRSELEVDDATWERGRGWALSTAVAELSYYRQTNQFMAGRARRQIAAVLNG